MSLTVQYGRPGSDGLGDQNTEEFESSPTTHMFFHVMNAQSHVVLPDKFAAQTMTCTNATEENCNAGDHHSLA